MRGNETASPSGKFCTTASERRRPAPEACACSRGEGLTCRPIPIASVRAAENVACGDVPMAPKPTPTARPSGKLCTVIATTNSNTRRQLRRASNASLFAVAASTASPFARAIASRDSTTDVTALASGSGNTLPANHTKAPPARKPKLTGSHARPSKAATAGADSANSNAGSSSDHTEAAIMTPPLKPRARSRTLRMADALSCLGTTNTAAAPRAVTPHVNNVPSSAC